MHTALLHRLKALIIFRVFFITVLVGSFLLLNVGYQKLTHPRTILYLVIGLYMLSIVYATVLSRLRNLVLFAYFQLIIDSMAGIAVVFLTGGIESWFSSIMLLVVMASAITLDKKAGFVIATVCSILYGLIIDLQFYGIIPIGFDPTLRERDFFYNLFTHISALYLTAFLTGQLSSRLEKTTKRLEEKDSSLKDLTLFNRELIESLPSGLLTTDRAGRITIFNRAAESITGMNRSEALGQHLADVFPFLSFPPPPGRREGTIRHGAEMKIVGLTVSITMDSEHRETGHICVFQDITQLKNLETELKHRETLAVIGELSANMAHEIRNPLASLKGSIEMLKEGVLTQDRSEKLMTIALNEMDRLNKIITDFLNYSRPKPPEFSTFDLHQMLDETVELIRGAVASTDRILIKKHFGGANEVSADPHKLRQVFLNLGMNAIEAMPEGGTLAIETRRDVLSTTIVFRDTGVGIPPANLREVFYPFFTTKESGTGLGLSIAYRIIEEHNGSITLTSTPGKGTAFEVMIPVEPTSIPYEGVPRGERTEISVFGRP